jgi:hypothetical protein
MPRGRQPQGETTLSNAERQARYRARHKDDRPTSIVRVRYRRPADRRSRPQRWDDVVAELLALQAEFVAWYDALPEGLRDTATAEALRAIAELDLTELQAIIRRAASAVIDMRLYRGNPVWCRTGNAPRGADTA